MWNYRDEAVDDDRTYGEDIVGFGVEAIDGSIGKVDKASHEVGSSYLVVDTGPWIFGQKVLIPAGTVERVD
ncbi:MAG TPA: PRC-barrel domain containing protein, partial [Acidimicrobiia bacterium]|nr:PRC-barrel domain containing protein [Acidimicrobiia bacterium]